ncbi:response regulator [Aeromonas hydrophila]
MVDDDEAVLDSLRFMLESCDERQLFSFADGERFLAEVDLHQPACLILDCRMPGLSGPEVQQRLKAAQSPIAILFLTGHGEVPLAVESLKQGGGGFLAKAGTAGPPARRHRPGRAGNAECGHPFRPAGRLSAAHPARAPAAAAHRPGPQKSADCAGSLHLGAHVEVCRASLMKRLEVDSLAKLMLLYANVHSAP